MSKLTLSVDARVVSRAKQYAKRHGLSLSKMVEAYLATVANPAPASTSAAPILRSLRGILKNADMGASRKTSTRRKKFEAAQESAHERYGEAFQKLAE
jgi:hypothetical protein